MSENRGQIFSDSLINIIASLVFTVALQLLCYPVLSRFLSNDEYGVVLTLSGLANTFAAMLSVPSNNARLLMEGSYSQIGQYGDFRLFLLGEYIAGGLATAALSYFLVRDAFISFCVAVIAILTMYRSYHSVSFRIKIDFVKMLKLNCFLALGYVVGSGLAYYFGIWVIPFIVGELGACVYLVSSAQTAHEPLRTTPLCRESVKKTTLIVVGNVAGSLMTYMDRFFLYPLMGAAAVAWYTIASYMGKLVGTVLNPISSVLLTYFVRDGDGITKANFWKRTILFLLLSAMSLLFTVAVSKPILELLYPSLVTEAEPYILYASTGATTVVLCNLMQPMLLAYADTKWQPVVQLSYLVVYFPFAFFFTTGFGLTGFCFAVIISNLFRFSFMAAVTFISISQKSSNSSVGFPAE